MEFESGTYLQRVRRASSIDASFIVWPPWPAPELTARLPISTYIARLVSTLSCRERCSQRCRIAVREHLDVFVLVVDGPSLRGSRRRWKALRSSVAPPRVWRILTTHLSATHRVHALS